MIGLGFRLGKRLKKIATESTPPAWTPADIADLAIFFHFKEGNGSCFNGTDPVVVSGGGGMDKIIGLYGAEVTQAEGSVVLQPDGLQLAADGSTSMAFASQFSATDITIYWSMILGVASSVACFASDTAQPSLLGGEGAVVIYDNATNSFNNNSGTGLVMGRLSMDAAGDFSMLSTGGVAAVTGTVTNNGFDFNQIGGIGAIGAGNDSESNRFRLVIAIKRAIALDSAEDLLIRNWITANDGAEL